MNDFNQRLIEEFGQGIVDHVSRNRGKYAIGAGVAGLAGYGAYNGNLGSAANNLINTGAGTLGFATSDLPYEEAPYGQIVDQGLDTTQNIYQAPIDPQVELEPDESFKIGQVAGNVVNSIHQAGDHVRGMFESEELVNPSVDDEDDKPSAAAEVATLVGGSAAVLTGVANADKIGKAATAVTTKVKDTVKNAGDSVASSVKGTAQKATTSIADILLKTSLKLKDSKDTNDKAIKNRKDAAEVRTKESEAKKAKEKREVYNNAARLKEKLRKR